MSDKPREYWLQFEAQTNRVLVYHSGERIPGGAVHVIEYAAYDDLQSKLWHLEKQYDVARENYDTLKAKLAEVEAEATSLKDQLAWSIKNENMYKAETHTALINLERMREQLSDCGALYESAKDTFKELVREREAAKVMREALEQIQSLAANEHEQGDSKALDDVLDLTCETFKALAKADEIRGGE